MWQKYEILDSISMELNSNIDKLVISYKGGEDLFKRRIVEIIRPALIKKIDNVNHKIVNDINIIKQMGKSMFDDIYINEGLLWYFIYKKKRETLWEILEY